MFKMSKDSKSGAAASNHADMGMTDDVAQACEMLLDIDGHIHAPFLYAIQRWAL